MPYVPKYKYKYIIKIVIVLISTCISTSTKNVVLKVLGPMPGRNTGYKCSLNIGTIYIYTPSPSNT